MDRDIPVFNRPVMQKIFRKNQQKHLQRLRNIRSGNSNRTMPIYPNNHTLSNKKAILAEQHKKTQIEKQNVLLFNKMMRIMKRNDPHNQPNQALMYRTNKIPSQNSRIMQQNRGILQRIQHQRPTISNKKLQQERLKNLNILRFLGKYPNSGVSRVTHDTSSQIGRKSQTKKKHQSFYNNHRDTDLQEFQIDDQMYDQQIRRYQDQINKLKDRSSDSASGRRKYMSQAVNRNNNVQNNKIDSEESQGLVKLAAVDINNQPQFFKNINNGRQNSKPSAKSEHVDDHHSQSHPQKPQYQKPQPISKQIVLFQKMSTINKQQASVHFMRLYNIYKIRAIFEQPYKGAQIYQLEIPEQQGNQFFSQNNYDYGKICKMLIVQDGQLVVNPALQQYQSQRQMRDLQQIKQKKQTEIHRKISQQRTDQEQQRNWAKYEEALQQSIQ